MPYWQLYYHIVFATWGRQPRLTDALGEQACRLLRRKAEDLGCVLHVIHARPDHIHIVLSIPPSRAIANVVGQLKGSSSHALAASSALASDFRWQGDYGVLSFGKRHLPAVVAYVRDQDRRHSNNHLWPELERMADASASQDGQEQSSTRTGQSLEATGARRAPGYDVSGR